MTKSPLLYHNTRLIDNKTSLLKFRKITNSALFCWTIKVYHNMKDIVQKSTINTPRDTNALEICMTDSFHFEHIRSIWTYARERFLNLHITPNEKPLCSLMETYCTYYLPSAESFCVSNE